jgi:hypothetical protein
MILGHAHVSGGENENREKSLYGGDYGVHEGLYVRAPPGDECPSETLILAMRAAGGHLIARRNA